MPEEHLEALRAVYGRWSEGDFRAGLELFHPEIEFVMGTGFPDPGTYTGRDGVARYMRLFLEPWERITIAAEEMVDAGDAVVVRVVQRGTGSGSGAETEFRYDQVWTFSDRGKVVRFETFRDRDEALRAAFGETGQAGRARRASPEYPGGNIDATPGT